MYSFSKLMVGIELRVDNAALIRYAFHLSELFESEKVIFVHIAANLEAAKENYNGDQPYEQYLKGLVDQQLRRYFSDDRAAVEVDVLEGKPEEQLIHWATIREADLLMIGTPMPTKEKKVTPHHLARLAPCSVALVPARATSQLKQLFVPVDNSSYTTMSLDKAEYLYKKNSDMEVMLYHCMSPPNTFLVPGASRYKQFVEEMKKEVRKEMEEVSKKADNQANWNFVLETCNKHIGDCLANKANSINTDLMIIGSKGRTNAAATLMGSVTERVIKNEPDAPLLILRQKGEHSGLIEELFQSDQVFDLK